MGNLTHKTKFKPLCLIILSLLMMALTGPLLISALSFSFNEHNFYDVGDYGKYEIKDWFGISKLQDLELKTNTEICSDNCRAEIPINHYQDGILVEDIRFIDIMSGKETEITNYELKVDGENYNIGDQLPKGDYNLEILGEVYFKEVDWQIKTHGEWLEAWAIWGAGSELKHYYKFDNSTGEPADLIGGSHLTKVGTVTQGVDGIINFAVELDGTNDYMTMPNNDFINNLDDKNFTMSFWVKPNETKRMAIFAGASDNWFGVDYHFQGTRNINLWASSSGAAWNLINADPAGNGIGTESIPINQWNHIVVVRNGTTWRTFINGVQDVNVNVAGSIVQKAEVKKIGEWGAAIPDWNGSIDEVGFWNRSLTNKEINELYNGGLGIAFGTFSPSINLDSPKNNLETIETTIFFNSTAFASEGRTIVNASLLHNASGSFIRVSSKTGLTSDVEIINFTDTFTLGNYIWGEEVCDDTGSCSFSINRTLSIVGLLETNRTFNNLTFGGSEEEFTMSFILGQGLTISDAKLNYNGTNYTSNILFLGGEYTLTNNIIIPTVNKNTNFSFNFIVIANGQTFESSSSQQEVVPINISKCGAGGTVILDISLFEEKLKTNLSGDIEINTQALEKSLLQQAGSLNLTFNNTDNGKICLSPIEAAEDLYLDAEIKYSSEGYATEFYYIQRADLTDYPINLSLFDLSNNESTEFLVTYQDRNLVFVEGAIVQLQRKYISEDLYEVVEAPLTSDSGTVVVHIDLNTNKYKATVVKNGVVLDIFNNLVFSCENELSGQCTQKLFGLIDPQNDISIEKLTDFSYAITQSNDTITTLFSIPSGVPQTVNILMTQIDQFNNSYICNNTIFSSAGSVDCLITPTIGPSYLGLAIKKSGEIQAQKSYVVEEDLSLDFLGNNYFILFILMLSVVGMAFTSPEWIIINGVLTMVIAGALYLANGVNFVVGLGNLIWLLIAAVILILKQTQQEDR